MSRFGFVGSSYTSESPNVADNRTLNWYAEKVEEDGASPIAQYPTPGLKPFADLSGSRIYGIHEFGGRLFAVGSNFTEIDSGGNVTPYNFLPPPTGPVTMAANNSGQLLICSEGQLWLFPLILAGQIVSAVSTYNTRNISIVERIGPVGPHRLYSLRLTTTTATPSSWTSGTVLTFGGLTTATYLNGLNYTLQYGGGTNSLTFFPGLPASSYGPSPDTGAVFDITTTVIITLTTPVTYQVGDQISFIGVTNLAGLNGRIFTITGVSGNTFTISAPGLNINYSGAETGYAITPGQIAIPTRVNVPGGYFAQIFYTDDYFVALIENSQKFQISGLGDGTAWNPIDTFQVSQFPDNIVGMFIDHRDVWAFGPKQTIVYRNTGDPLIPFQPIDGAFIEQGLAARWSVAKLDNSIFWIGADDRGQGIAWRANGYTPLRVSNHAVENAWRQYTTISDAIAFTYQENGHAFWQIWFPSADATWVYDAATGQWHERSWFNGGIDHAHRSCNHAFVFGKHIVGDRASAGLLDMSLNNLFDTINTLIGPVDYPIHRLRRAPQVSNEQKYVFYQKMEVYLETGIIPPNTLLDPQISLRWSNDGGHSWSSYHQQSAGMHGEYSKRIIWRRLGRGRNRIFELSATDPMSYRVVDAYLDAVPGAV